MERAGYVFVLVSVVLLFVNESQFYTTRKSAHTRP